MKRALTANIGVMIVAGLILLSVPLFFHVPYSRATDGPPSVGQTLIREGTLAAELAKTYGMPGDVAEAEAESWLAEKGIIPANGWIADYPVTPDIIGELRKSVEEAGESGNINMDKSGAVSRFDAIVAAMGVGIQPLSGGNYARVAEYNNDIVPAAEVVNYYTYEGPPVVTYYAPPPYYYGLYSWISYPFWCDGFWFGGFFILNDFHRSVFIGRDHHRGFISNHFRDREHHRFSRIDPLTRSSGIRSNPGGSRQSIRSDINSPRATAPPAIRSTSVRTNTSATRFNAPPAMRSAPFSTSGTQRPFQGTGRSFTPSARGNVSRADNSISVRSGMSHQFGFNGAARTFSTPVSRPVTSLSTFTVPHSSPARMGITTQARSFAPPSTSSRSFNSGFSGGFSRGMSGGFSSRGSAGGFSGGHARR